MVIFFLQRTSVASTVKCLNEPEWGDIYSSRVPLFRRLQSDDQRLTSQQVIERLPEVGQDWTMKSSNPIADKLTSPLNPFCPAPLSH